jgi:hypothetical protein
MIPPTPRQNASYLRRLLQRGEIEVVDPATYQTIPTMIEVRGSRVLLMPFAPDASAAPSAEECEWARLLERLRKAVALEDAEALVRAVEIEAARHGVLRDAS